MATSLPLVPTLMAVPLAQSPTSTDIVSVPTGQNSTQVFWAPEAPEAASSYKQLLSCASNVSPEEVSFFRCCTCHTSYYQIGSLSFTLFSSKC